jgi:hypothetical protein
VRDGRLGGAMTKRIPRAERLSISILGRMKEIDGDINQFQNEIATCHDYSLLWDAMNRSRSPSRSSRTTMRS